MDIFESESYLRYGDDSLKHEMENFNARLVSIVKSKQLSPTINIDSEIGDLFQLLDSKLSNIQAEIERLQKIANTVPEFQEIQFKKAIIYNYRDFKNYAMEVIEDVQNVIIVLNSNIIKCVKRKIVVSDNDDPMGIQYWYYSQNPDTESDIIFVIFENPETNQYYGIDIEGNKASGNMSDYELLSEPPSCNYFIITDPSLFAQDILRIKTDTKKKLLFENQFFKYVNRNCFISYHNHEPDTFSNWMTGPCDACRGIYRERIHDSELQNYKFSEQMFNRLAQTGSIWIRTAVYPVHNSVWEYFLLYFNLSISNNEIYNTKIILQQFKCLFTKDENEEKILYQKIENQLYPKKPLIEFFLPEIKFLLHRIYIPNSLQGEWEKYVREHNKPVDTKPESFLQYLLNVVLSNLVDRDLLKSLLSTLSEMTTSLTKDMSTTDGRMNYKFISDIIDRVLRKFKLTQEGGKLGNNKNVSKRKKGSKLLNNKISNRGKKISRKHQN